MCGEDKFVQDGIIRNLLPVSMPRITEKEEHMLVSNNL
jgi:hypothetical protein